MRHVDMAQIADYHKFINAVGAGITFSRIEKPSNLVFANESFYSLTGYKPEEVIGRNCNFLQGEETDQQTVNEIRSALKKGEKFAGEIVNYRKNGDPFWNFLVINPIFNNTGRITHFAGFQHDISQQKESERSLIARTKEFNNFIYRASHDLRGPLASILGLSHVSLDISAEEALQRLEMVNQTASRLDRILHKFIRTIELQDYVLQPSNIHFKNLVNDIFDEILLQNDESKISFQVNDAEISIIRTDKLVLSVILRNLLENAIIFADRTKQVSSLAVSIVPASDNTILITVSDNGIGIPEIMQPNVTEMFVKGNHDIAGSGLGLYLTKQCVQKLGGRLSIKSSLHAGTEVLVQLPVY